MSYPLERTEEVRRMALELGFEACRITDASAPSSGDRFRAALAEGRHAEMHWLERNAEKRTDPERVLPGLRSVVLVAASYGEAAEERAEPSATRDQLGLTGVVARYARHLDYHDILGIRLKELARRLNVLGGPETRSLWYVDTGPILERDLAQRAGMGFIGKHTNLISRQLGNWLLLGEVLTTLVLAADSAEPNRCGSCTRCLTACPTNALPAPFTLDARRCISYLTIEHKGSIPLELRPLMGDRIYGCDDCLAVCPWNRFAREGALLKSYFRPDLARPDLLELLALNTEGFRARFAGTPILRTKRRGLLRNVCVALGNLGDEAALPALRRAATDSEPLVAEHAEWAITRIRDHQEGSGP